MAPSQIKSRIILVRVLVTDFGIPCAAVRNWVIAPIVICTISRLASSVGLLLFQFLRVDLILSIIGFQGWVRLVLFPIHAPRHRMACPLLASLIFSCRGRSSGWSFLVCITRSLCSWVPMGTISVFSILNFAPDALHHLERIIWRVSDLSDSDR